MTISTSDLLARLIDERQAPGLTLLVKGDVIGVDGDLKVLYMSEEDAGGYRKVKITAPGSSGKWRNIITWGNVPERLENDGHTVLWFIVLERESVFSLFRMRSWSTGVAWTMEELEIDDLDHLELVNLFQFMTGCTCTE
jgi:hypothetical protein